MVTVNGIHVDAFLVADLEFGKLGFEAGDDLALAFNERQRVAAAGGVEGLALRVGQGVME